MKVSLKEYPTHTHTTHTHTHTQILNEFLLKTKQNTFKIHFIYFYLEIFFRNNEINLKLRRNLLKYISFNLIIKLLIIK